MVKIGQELVPQLGHIGTWKEAGYKCRGGKYMWCACSICGKERWVPIHKGKPRYLRCRLCVNTLVNVGDRGGAWKGGKIRTTDGYIKIWLPKNDFFHSMLTKDGYVMEHRLIMARHINRCLLPWEIVHHKNGIRDDNQIENLQLLPNHHSHVSDSILKGRLTRQTKEIEKLREKIILLELENASLKTK